VVDELHNETSGERTFSIAGIAKGGRLIEPAEGGHSASAFKSRLSEKNELREIAFLRSSIVSVSRRRKMPSSRVALP
jgi:hypothetical protein